MKNILLIATGGTIASKNTEDGLAPAMASGEILQYVPSIFDLCHVEQVQLLNIDSTNMQPKHWLMISEAIYENYERKHCENEEKGCLRSCISNVVKTCTPEKLNDWRKETGAVLF